MKKVIVPIASLLSIGLSFTACQKQQAVKQQPSAVNYQLSDACFKGVTKTAKGFLKFDNEDSYNKILNLLKDLNTSAYDAWEKKLGYTSLRTHRALSPNAKGGNIPTSTDEDLNKSFDDELFLTVIDQYGVVQIGNIIFKAETDIDFVWTLSSEHLDRYGDLLGRSFDPTVMNIFRISEDETRTQEAWDIVLNGTVGIDESNGSYQTLGIFGNDHQVNDDVSDAGGLIYRADCKASYQTALFYYSLMTELKYMRKYSGSGNITPWQQQTTDIWASYNSYCKYLSKKNGSTEQNPSFPGQVHDNKYNWRPYCSNRGLHTYDMETYFTYNSLASSGGNRIVNVGIHK